MRRSLPPTRSRGVCASGKVRYRTAYEAGQVVKAAQATAELMGSSYRPIRAYWCIACTGGWHLTSKASARV